MGFSFIAGIFITIAWVYRLTGLLIIAKIYNLPIKSISIFSGRFKSFYYDTIEFVLGFVPYRTSCLFDDYYDQYFFEISFKKQRHLAYAITFIVYFVTVLLLTVFVSRHMEYSENFKLIFSILGISVTYLLGIVDQAEFIQKLNLLTVNTNKTVLFGASIIMAYGIFEYIYFIINDQLVDSFLIDTNQIKPVLFSSAMTLFPLVLEIVLIVKLVFMTMGLPGSLLWLILFIAGSALTGSMIFYLIKLYSDQIKKYSPQTDPALYGNSAGGFNYNYDSTFQNEKKVLVPGGIVLTDNSAITYVPPPEVTPDDYQSLEKLLGHNIANITGRIAYFESEESAVGSYNYVVSMVEKLNKKNMCFSVEVYELVNFNIGFYSPYHVVMAFDSATFDLIFGKISSIGDNGADGFNGKEIDTFRSYNRLLKRQIWSKKAARGSTSKSKNKPGAGRTEYAENGEIIHLDMDADGYKEIIEYYHPGATYCYKRYYDYNFNGKTDFYEIIDERSGKVVSTHIDRDSWPLVKNVGTKSWLDEKRKEAIKFWDAPGNRERQFGICDITNQEIPRGQGYMLTSHDVLSSESYVQKQFYSRKLMVNIPLPDEFNNPTFKMINWFARCSLTDWHVSEKGISLYWSKSKKMGSVNKVNKSGTGVKINSKKKEGKNSEEKKVRKRK